MKLEEKLVYLRKEKGMSQLNLAEMMDVSRQAISRWETGVAIPSTENLKYLGELYNVTVDFLLNDNADTPLKNADEMSVATLETNIPAKNNRKAKKIIIISICFLFVIAIVYIFIQMRYRNDVVLMEDMPVQDVVEISGDIEFNW